MIVAVTAKGPELSSEVDPRFGRAAYIVFIDTDTGDVEVLDNRKNAEALRGAGIQTASTVAERGAKALVTGHCGPNAFEVLKSAGIKVANQSGGTVKSALDAFLDDKLQIMEKADVEGNS